MGYTLTDEDIARLRRHAKLAEPYTPEEDPWRTLDRIPTKEEALRITATDAIDLLKRCGIPLEE